ncbi:hypothetical protein QFZ30_000214 [Arthrobacter pascens]|nr:hypothetical protein [Arthrobacter pascens]
MDLRLYFSAVSFLTARTSLSSASEAVSIVRPAGTLVPSSVATSSEETALVAGSRYCRRAPPYSGMRSMEPSLRAGMVTSRLPMLGFSVTWTPLLFRASA